ncbi:putative disease resistance protein At1g50180 [Silene latifolia]|uniref:putative disease resistance protein At1g50180 n=1 Tax=Silene latifolia TaxID=37657 RepID=UPI003D78A171
MTELLALAAQHIDSKINQELKERSVKVISELNTLSSELKNVNKLMIDAEGRTKELSKMPDFQSCVKEMQRIAYEAEDKVDNLISESTFLSFMGSKTLRGLIDRTRAIKGKLGELAEGSKIGAVSRERGSQVPQGHLPAKDDFVIGIDHQITQIVNLLTGKPDFNGGKLAMVGMGGSGKTTLARSVYNHRTVKAHFDHKVWVSVSQGWDTPIMLIDILKQIREQQRSFFARPSNDEELGNNPNKLVTRLKERLDKKVCLLVLDDVWDLQSLHNFIGLIQGDDFESRTYTIVITSRQTPLSKSNTAHTNWYVHGPQCLTDEDSWILLRKVASNPSKELSDDYRCMGIDLLRKCHGLPLAIVALGRQLKTKNSKREWQEVLLDIEGEAGIFIFAPVKKSVWLSYGELPYYLKPCFLYLGLSPEGTISAGKLIRMWIAEGFIDHLCHGQETLEVAGRRCLQGLIDHAMVQIVQKTYSGKVKTIQIHGIMRELALSKARELEFLTAASFEPRAVGETSRRAAIFRRYDFTFITCFILNYSPGRKSDILPANNSVVRSLSIFEQFEQSSNSSTPEICTNNVTQRFSELDNVFKMYKLLRVLDIFGIQTPAGTLPDEIKNLRHLTYLRIRSTNIRKLPHSIGELHCLITLDYRNVRSDAEIQVPNVLWKLNRLRHLYLPKEMSGTAVVLKLDTLKDLVTLWGVGGGTWLLQEMGKLYSTLSKLFIHRMSTMDQLNAVHSSPVMADNGCLDALALDWYGFEMSNLDALQAKQSLHKLRLKGKGPDRLHLQGIQFPAKLGKLELYYTQLERPETMALLGKLVLLKVLRLFKDSYVGCEWSCGKEAFPILEELKLASLPKLEKWVMEDGAMPCLKRLSIFCCTNLKRLPEGLKRVQSLERLEIGRMPSDFIRRLRKEDKQEKEGEDFHIIKHIPKVVYPPHYGEK